MIIICFNLGVVCDQEELWMETAVDDPATEEEARQGGLTPISIDPRLYHDIQVQLSRLIGKADQLIGNVTTNLAESWMHVRTKFDGGESGKQKPKWIMGTSLHGSWVAAKHG